MKKNFLGDIRPMTHLGSKPKKIVLDDEEIDKEIQDEMEEELPRRKHTPPPSDDDQDDQLVHAHLSWGKLGAFIALGLVVLGGVLYGLSFLFRGALVTVNPKKVSGTIDLTLTAGHEDTSTIHYEVMTLPETITKDVVATHTDTANMKAKGSVVIYNFQTVPQQLIATTRFADPNGKVFRLQSEVLVPKKVGSTPGQVTATLVADAGGPEGNIPLSDFTIVAFKGTAKEKLVYGKGKTEFTGGTSGSVFFLTDDEYKTAATDLAAQLNAKLSDEVLKQVPDGYVVLPDSLSFTPDAIKNDPSTTATITVTYGGKERGILIKKDELEKAFLDAIAVGETVSADQVTFRGAEKLVYATTTDLSKDSQGILPKTISFTVKGDLTAVWNIDQAAIKQLLVGAKRSVFASRMQTIPAVAGAELVLRPFWMNTLPTDTAKIKITIKE